MERPPWVVERPAVVVESPKNDGNMANVMKAGVLKYGT